MTETAETKAETPFWRFSLHFYRQPGVSDACIALQDRCGVDVNLLLFLFWLADSGRLLTSDEIKNLDDSVRDWRNLTIIPIRDARRKLKGVRTLVDPGMQEAFRNRVKAVELEAERLQQEGLYAFTQSGPPGRPAAPGDAVRANVSAYARLIGVSFPPNTAALLVSAFNSIEHGRYGAMKAAAGRA